MNRWRGLCASLFALGAVALSGCAAAGTGASTAAVTGPGGTSTNIAITVPATSGAATPVVLDRGHWSVLARSPLGKLYGQVFVWDGVELLELGGTKGGPSGGTPSSSGAAYNPARHRWRRVANAPAAVRPLNAASVWTGSQVFVFGGPAGAHATVPNVAGLYDPSTNRWTVTSRAPIGPFGGTATAVWTGTRVILAGMTGGNPSTLGLAAYDPATNTWTRLQPPIPAHHPPMGIAIVNTDSGVLLWSLWGYFQRVGPSTFTSHFGVDVFRLGTSGHWANVTGSWPQGHTVDSPLYTGTQVLVAPGQIWCGPCSHPAPFNEHGYAVNPATLSIAPLPHGPLDDLGPQILWTGAAELSFNSGGEIVGPRVHVLPGDIAIYNPRTHRWHRGPRAPKQIDSAPAVWSGNKLYVLAQDAHLLAYGG